jgi:hypothetical protein
MLWAGQSEVSSSVQFSYVREAEKRLCYSWLSWALQGQLWQEDLGMGNWRIFTVLKSVATIQLVQAWKWLSRYCGDLWIV